MFTLVRRHTKMPKKTKVETKVIGEFDGKVTEVDRPNGVGYIETPCGKKATFYLNNLPNNVRARVRLNLRFTMKQQGTRMPIARCIKTT